MNEKLTSIKILFFSLTLVFIGSVTFADETQQASDPVVSPIEDTLKAQ